MRLTSGLRLGPYEVLSLLGTGGMAEVYRARDTRLGRDIALKVVNEALAGDLELVKRFEQEARLAGSLNHPNLVAVYDFGVHEGAPYFVTELLHGETLRARLGRGRVPVSRALEWALQMARGLAAAHARGVVHRDVKPDNVFLGADGTVKLLDFGIAKLAERTVRDLGTRDLMDVTETPTGGMTRTGSVLGTPGYMSPEQVRGEPLDSRSDIFSWAATVYEILAGHRAFPGNTVVESGYAILHNDPQPLPAEVWPPLARIVLRCLEKEPGRRLQSATDLVFALEALSSDTGAGTGPLRAEPSAAHRRGRVVAIGAALVLGVVLALLAGRRVASAPVPTFEPVSFRWGTVTAARFLPDGRIAYSAAFEDHPEQLFVRPTGSLLSQSLALDDVRLQSAIGGGELGVLLRPRHSLLRTSRGTLARVPSVGGAPRELIEGVEYADWSARGDLLVVREVLGSRVLESPPGHEVFRTSGWISDPRFSFTGDRIGFLHHPEYGDDMGELVVLDRSGTPRTLSTRWPTSGGLAWTPDDREVWFTAGRDARDGIRAVSLAGKTRDVFTSSGKIFLEDIRQNGEVLLSTQIEREESVYLAPDGHQVLLSWSDWTGTISKVTNEGLVLSSAVQPIGNEQGLAPSLAILQSVDGSPAQVLGPGYSLDLSADARWAMLLDETSIRILPTGAGEPKVFDLRGVSVVAARWMPDQQTILLAGRRASDGAARLHTLGPDGQLSGPIGAAEFGGRRALHISPDGRWVAGSTPEFRVVLVSLPGGTPVPLPAELRDTLPRGWSSGGHLWLSQGGDRAPARLRLLRVSVPDGRILEQRTISPPEASGAMDIVHLVISPDGRNVVFMFHRFLGSLVIARGLWAP